MKFKQASSSYQKLIEAAKLAYANKMKHSMTFQKLGFPQIWEFPDSVLSKGKSAIPPLSNEHEIYSLRLLVKQNCLLKKLFSEL